MAKKVLKISLEYCKLLILLMIKMTSKVQLDSSDMKNICYIYNQNNIMYIVYNCVGIHVK